jgi:serine/threonine protein kinase
MPCCGAEADDHGGSAAGDKMVKKIFKDGESGRRASVAASLPAVPATEKKLNLNPCCLADFDLGPILGTGSFGRVHLAKHKKTGAVTAIKMLSKSQILKTKQVSHIKAEKDILDTVGYPFLVNMLGSFQDEERLYLVLEYVVGGEFFTHLRSAGRFFGGHGALLRRADPAQLRVHPLDGHHLPGPEA